MPRPILRICVLFLHDVDHAPANKLKAGLVFFREI